MWLLIVAIIVKTMALDTRFWSVFIFMTTSAFLLAAVSTPYHVKGAAVTFGEQGLWGVDSGKVFIHYFISSTLIVYKLL